MNTREKYKSSVMNTYGRQDLLIVSGKGSTCYDENGKKYIDFGSGIGVNSLGFAQDDWAQAISTQASTMQHISNLYYTIPGGDLAHTLCNITGYTNVFFGNSGAESNEGAIKIARKYSYDKYGADAKRNKILTLVNSFHGRTLATLSATGQDFFHKYFFPFPEGFEHAPANNLEAVIEKLSSGEFCGIILEFIQGEGGVIPLDKDFVQGVAKYCEANDIIFIGDEVQTGVARTGKFLASEYFDVKPNVTTLAKGLGGGLPIGAILADEKVSKVLGPSDHATTFGANPVVCAGANVVLSKVADPKFLEEVTQKGEFIKNELLALDEVESVDGLGLMLGINLKTKVAGDVITDCIANGLIPLSAKTKIRLLPPLNISHEELTAGLNILKEAITK